MAENKEYMIHQEEDDGSIQISEDVLASIASTTARWRWTASAL